MDDTLTPKLTRLILEHILENHTLSEDPAHPHKEDDVAYTYLTTLLDFTNEMIGAFLNDTSVSETELIRFLREKGFELVIRDDGKRAGIAIKKLILDVDSEDEGEDEDEDDEDDDDEEEEDDEEDGDGSSEEDDDIPDTLRKLIRKRMEGSEK